MRIKSFLIFIFASGAIILVSMWINAEYSVNKLSKTLNREIQASIVNQTNGFFSPAKALNRNLVVLLHNYFDDPIQKISARETMYDYFKEIMNVYPQFRMINYSDIHGAHEMLIRMSDDTFSKRSVRNNGSQITDTWEHENSAWLEKYNNSTKPAISGFDPRRMGWYGIAQTTRTITWTSVYLLNDNNLPGITCVAPIYDKLDNLAGVCCIGIAINELSVLLGTIKPTPGTKIFILDHQKNIIALQARTEEELDMLLAQNKDNQDRITFNVSSVSTLPEEADRFLLESLLKSSLLKNGRETKTIKYNNKKYRASMAPIAIGDGLDLTLSILIPEDDIVRNIRRNTVITAILFCLIFTIAVIKRPKHKPKPEENQQPVQERDRQPKPEEIITKETALEEILPKASEDFIACYMQDIFKIYKVRMVVSENTIKMFSDAFEFRLLDRLFIEEKNEVVNIYELISLKDGISENLKKLYKYYETGLSHYFNRDWNSGYKYFCTVLKYLPNDNPAKIMRERCVQYHKNTPPPDDWNGTVTSF